MCSHTNTFQQAQAYLLHPPFIHSHLHQNASKSSAVTLSHISGLKIELYKMCSNGSTIEVTSNRCVFIYQTDLIDTINTTRLIHFPNKTLHFDVETLIIHEVWKCRTTSMFIAIRLFNEHKLRFQLNV